MREIDNQVLENAQVRLEPITEAHRPVFHDLVPQTDADHWRYISKVGLGDVDGWLDWHLEQIAARKTHPYVVFDRQHARWVGMTSFLTIEPAHDRLEVGMTWYVPSAQGTGVNPAAKLLLLSYAFNDLECRRIDIKCDALNLRSRRAIVKLGAKEEGILRENMKVHDGKGGMRYRDTAMHSILLSEWPRVREGLLRRLEAYAAREDA